MTTAERIGLICVDCGAYFATDAPPDPWGYGCPHLVRQRAATELLRQDSCTVDGCNGVHKWNPSMAYCSEFRQWEVWHLHG